MAQMSLDRGLEKLGQRAKIVRAILIAYVVLSALTVLVSVGEAMRIVDLEAETLDSASMLGGLIYLLYALAFLTSIVLVGMWIYRAHANLRVAGIEGLEYKPGWAVGWFFVPFANLVKPQAAMRELWRESTANAAGEGPLTAWWAAWLIGNILSNIGLRMESSGNDGLSQAGLVLDGLGTVGLIAAALLLARIVAEITTSQESVLGVAHVFE